MENVTARQTRGQELALNSDIVLRRGYYHVPSATRQNVTYKVHDQNFNCDCPDYTFTHQKCKHIFAVEAFANKQASNVKTFVPRSGFSQDWRNYNKSQTTEKANFLYLLSDLTRNISEPENATGRPSLPLGDMIFAIVFKVYSQMSSRRFTTDLKDAHAKGYISECPHYNSLLRYMEKTSLTPYLEMLVEETSKPLAALETDFAVDSTGLSISNTVSWNQAKHTDKKMLIKKNWIKIHCAIGTKTNVISGVRISDKRGWDSNYFIPVMEMTQKNFDVQEVSADMAYSNMKTIAYNEANGIRSFIPFKQKAVGDSFLSTSVWRKAFHFFSYNRAEFLQSYNKRSNAETTFHMLKSKFGTTLKSKSYEAQVNESLCKVICHNISCLIHSMNEFGITPEFLN